MRYLHPSREKDSQQITDVISKITKSYGVNAIENMTSHALDKYKIAGEKQIVQNPSDDQKAKLEKFKFENYEVFAIDMLISTGDGKLVKIKSTGCSF
jgi:methionine aminopeptidase